MIYRRAYTPAVREKLKQIGPSPEVIDEIYKRVLDYNRPMPVHIGTGERYTTEERIALQRQRLETLEELAKLRKVDAWVEFHLAQRVIISMTINGKVHNPRGRGH